MQAALGLAIAAGDAAAVDRPTQPHGRLEEASNPANPPPVGFSPLPPTEAVRVVRTVDDREIRKGELDEALLAMMRSAGTPGLSIAVLNRAEVVYRRAFGLQDVRSAKKVDEQTVFEAASLSKPLFAYFVMKHVDRGLIELDRPLYQYRPHPDLEHDERHQLITARMVLSHTSGLPNWREGQLEIHFTPGTRQSYSGEGYQYLANVLAHVRGVDDVGLGRLFQSEVAQPLGAAPLNYIWNESIARRLEPPIITPATTAISGPIAASTDETVSAWCS